VSKPKGTAGMSLQNKIVFWNRRVQMLLGWV